MQDWFLECGLQVGEPILSRPVGWPRSAATGAGNRYEVRGFPLSLRTARLTHAPPPTIGRYDFANGLTDTGRRQMKESAEYIEQVLEAAPRW